VKQIEFPKEEFLDIIETAVKIARKRMIDQCVIECCKTNNVNQCFAECTNKYSNYNSFTKADYIKALVYTSTVYREDINKLLRLLEQEARRKEYVKKKHGKYIIINSF